LFGALSLTRFLSPLLYGIDSKDPATFTAALVFLPAAALAGAWLPALRAARIEPTTALRTE
jgi:ABC-type lipoprotein release transport system permease subunit